VLAHFASVRYYLHGDIVGKYQLYDWNEVK